MCLKWNKSYLNFCYTKKDVSEWANALGTRNNCLLTSQFFLCQWGNSQLSVGLLYLMNALDLFLLCLPFSQCRTKSIELFTSSKLLSSSHSETFFSPFPLFQFHFLSEM